MKKIKNPTSLLILNLIISLCFTILGVISGVIIGGFFPAIVYAAHVLLLIFMIISFIVAIFDERKKGSEEKYESEEKYGYSMLWVYLYSFVLGIILYSALMYFLQSLGVSVVFFTLLGTIGFMVILGLASIKRRSDDILTLGPLLLAVTFAILISLLIQIFLGAFGIISFIITAISTVLFSFWTMYDVYKFEKYKDNITTYKELSPFVLDIYMDFINLFLDILRILVTIDDFFN